MPGRRPAACNIQQAFIEHISRGRALLSASNRSLTALPRPALCVHAEMARTKKSSQPQPECAITRRNRHEPRDKPLRSKEFRKGSEDALVTAAKQHRFPVPSAGRPHDAPLLQMLSCCSGRLSTYVSRMPAVCICLQTVRTLRRKIVA